LVALGVVAILVIAAFMFTAPQDGGDVNTTITVTDMLGRNVSIPDKVNKVVAVGAGALRWVTYLQGSELVVGVEEVEQSSSPIDVGGRTYRIVNPQYGNLTVIGPQHGGDKELIASVNPDVIFKSTYESWDCDNLQPPGYSGDRSL
jgi:iron complex transport system substrate-binding protein